MEKDENKEKYLLLNEMSFTIKALLDIYNNEKVSSDKIKKDIYKTIHTLLSPDKWGEKHAVSIMAREFAKENKFTKELEKVSWDDLGNAKDEKKTTGNGKRGLILEHIVPRKYLMDWLFRCNCDQKTIKLILEKTKCVVIHWEEDKRLRDYKLSSKRPNPAKAYYEIAQIKLEGLKKIDDIIKWVGFEDVSEFEKKIGI